jgi:alpha-1,3-fucosyltransferase
MSADVVPVVYGGANYSLYAPPHSYINVDDFATIEQLAEHLRYSDSIPI